MNSRKYSKAVFVAKPDKLYFFSRPKLGISFVPSGTCTNECVFCRPNIPAMQKLNPGVALISNKKHSVEKIVSEITKLIKKYPDADEIVITGVIGEPLLFLEDLKKLIVVLKKYVEVPVRLNTNGQASIITKQNSTNIVSQLREAGLDSLIVSLNAISEKDYEKICRPKIKRAFKSVIDFIKVARKRALPVKVSFVDYSGFEPSWPKINKEEVYKFVKKEFGLNKDSVIFRPYICNITESKA